VDLGGKNKAWISVAVTPEFKQRVEECAIDKGITMSKLLRDAIDEALVSHGH
jgi:hypothetical protein